MESMLKAFSQFEINHYQSPRERANAIALSGEKELVTSKAMLQHVRGLRVALRYERYRYLEPRHY